MYIYLSPSKTMRDEATLSPTTQSPLFQHQWPTVLDALERTLETVSTSEFYRVGAASAARIDAQRQDLACATTYPALFYYDGLVYKRLDASSLSPDALAYLDRHLRIASGLYGLVRPRDGIARYRLDWNDPLRIEGQRLSEYWQGPLASYIGDEPVINLASKEYSDPLAKALKRPLHHVLFYEEEGGRRKQKATSAKIARGTLLRLMAEANAMSIKEMRQLVPEGFHVDPSSSDDDCTVFVRSTAQ